MLSTSELLTAAKAARGIPSNYRLARVMGLSDNTLFRWHSGSGAPDDAHAAELAVMAGLDVEYVVAAMRAAREKDATLRAIFVRTAERLLLTSAASPGPMPPPGDNGGSDDDASGGSDDGDDNDPPHRLATAPGMCVMSTGEGTDALPVDGEKATRPALSSSRRAAKILRRPDARRPITGVHAQPYPTTHRSGFSRSC